MVPPPISLSQLLLIFATGAGVTAFLIVGKHWHINFTGDRPEHSEHKVHTGAVPRVGGVGVYVAGLTGLALMSPTLPDFTARVMWTLWGCLTIIFVAGLTEDLTRSVTPALRYGAALIAGVLFSLANDRYGISSVGIDTVDTTLNTAAVRVTFFAFAVAGLAHAFNLIDGQNGLCSGTSILVFVALGLVATRHGQGSLANLSYVMAAANMGFLLFNFPYGRIFLGDGGAYFNGGIAAVITVFVIEGAGGKVSPWLAILILIYPIWEALFSMMRRWIAGRRFYMPDNDHLHHRIQRRLVGRFGPASARYAAIPTLLAVTPFVIGAPFLAANILDVLAAVGGFIAIYSAAYIRLRDTAPAPRAYSKAP